MPSINRIRRENLNHILNDKHHGNRVTLADACSMTVSALGRYLSDKGSKRPFSDKMARVFETKLELQTGSLDVITRNDIEVYYVRVGFSGAGLHGFIRSLYQYEIIQEVSVQYGEEDIFIKIESTEEEYEKLVLDKIRLEPGVLRTRTSQALGNQRWQRQQAGIYRVPDESTSAKTHLEAFIRSKKQALRDELEALEKGEKIVIGNEDFHSLEYHHLIDDATDSIQITIHYEEHRHADLENDLLSTLQRINTELELKVLFIFDDSISSTSIDSLNMLILKLANNENTFAIRSIPERQWINSDYQHGAETLTIFDNAFISILERRSITLRYDKNVVAHYLRVFDKNWSKAEAA